MSRRLIARNNDLLRLQNDGYDLEARKGLLLVRDVPYVNGSRKVARGTLVVKLTLAGDDTAPPTEHTAFWIGEHPCDRQGNKLRAIENPSPPQDLGHDVFVNFMFSAKAVYRDHHHKVATYIGRIEGEARVLDPEITAKTFPAIADEEENAVFKYVDTASARAGIGAMNERLATQKIGIVGLGGTGSYVLDFVAKTLVPEIHLFDGDRMLNHNAFRSPGAATIEQLREKPCKVDYYSRQYGHMRNGIVPRAVYIGPDNVALLDGLDFVFLCVDRGGVKRAIVRHLTTAGTAFIEVGMGVVDVDGRLTGIVRTVCSTPDSRVEAAGHISYAEDDGGANEYASNIQVAELNALNAAMAVHRWKQHCGFYHDTRRAFLRSFSLPAGEMIVAGAA